MIRRPLHPDFNLAVLGEIKTTTIREKAWPVGVPIMFYNWNGRPYGKGSNQIDVAPVIVSRVTPITIGSIGPEDPLLGEPGTIFYAVREERPRNPYDLWKSEGFPCREAMDAWFRKLVRKPGDQITQYLHDFRLFQPATLCNQTSNQS